MSCVGNVCGTGGWTGPLPGDPDNNVALTATPAFGGIDINITYPVTNPYAVAYVILYRGLLPVFDAAVMRTKFTGEYFYDRVDSNTLYYYWVQLVSVNGTVAALIGPASAQARPTIEQMLEMLTGQIDAGVLAQSLKAQIAQIPLLDSSIIDEVNNRIAANQNLSDALAALNLNVTGTQTLVQQEVQQRTDADNAQVTAINNIGAKADANAAAITTEQQVRAAKDESLASDIEILYTQVGSASAAIDVEKTARSTADTANADLITALTSRVGTAESAIQTEQSTRATADTAITTSVTNLSSRVDGNAAAIQSEATTRATKDDALSTLITQVQATANNAATAAALQNEITTRANADSALSQQITTAQSTLGTNISQVQVNLQANIDTTNGKLNSIGSLYTVKLNVNGMIGGFGTYNDGNTVQMGFDVDSFWVGRTGSTMKKPFIISGGETFIDQAVIETLTFDKLRAADGSLIVANGKIKADYITAVNVTAQSVDVQTGGAGSPSTHLTNGLYQVTDPNGVVRVKLGVW